MRKVLKINAGIACSDRANEVEPRPNEVPLTVIASRAATWQSVPKDALIVLDCFAALAMTALFRRLRASAHFQFSFFNFQLTKGIACSDRANEVEPRPNEEHENAKPRRGEMCITDGGAQRNRRYNRGAESPKSIAQGNALCNELHPSPLSPERAKSFVNNRLRSERGRFSCASFAMTVILIILIILIKSWFRLLDCFSRASLSEPGFIGFTGLARCCASTKEQRYEGNQTRTFSFMSLRLPNEIKFIKYIIIKYILKSLPQEVDVKLNL